MRRVRVWSKAVLLGVCGAAVTLCLGRSPAAAPAVPAPEDWAQWRGPARAAHALSFSEPRAWPEELTRVWSVEIGPGLSSPVVAGKQVCLLTRAGEHEVAQCRSLADGRLLWRSRYPARFFANGGAVSPRRFPASRGKGPFATPVLDGDQLLTLGVDRVLSSFDRTSGELHWRHRLLPVDLPERVRYVCAPCGCAADGKYFDEPGVCPACGMGLSAEGVETSAKQGGGNYYGAASSPLVVDGLGIVQVGTLERGVLIAFEPGSGDQRWRWEGPIVAYSSPVVAEIHGERQLVAMTRTALVGLALANGELRWSFDLENNAHVTTPIVFEDLVIAASYQGPTFAIRVSRTPAGWTAEQAWQNAELTQWLGSPLLDDGHLYGFFHSRKGQFAALDARTGGTLWKSEGRQGESANLVATKSSLVALTDDGSLRVLRKTPESFEPLHRYQVADTPTWTYPVLVGRSLLIKDAESLTLWRID